MSAVKEMTLDQVFALSVCYIMEYLGLMTELTSEAEDYSEIKKLVENEMQDFKNSLTEEMLEMFRINPTIFLIQITEHTCVYITQKFASIRMEAFLKESAKRYRETISPKLAML